MLNTTTRLAKTPARNKNRSENVIRVGKTPFKQQGLLNKSRPLVDKTPFPNRVGDTTTKPQKGAKVDGAGGGGGGEIQWDQLPKLIESLVPLKGSSSTTTPGGAGVVEKRPSSTRKTVRTRRLSGLAFQTPAVNGNPWDVSVDEEEAVVEELEEEAVEVLDTDEIEYMAPNTLDLEYQPPFDFDLPNYSQVGKMLFNLGHSAMAHGDTPPPMAMAFDFEFGGWKPDWETINVIVGSPTDVDDPFYVPVPVAPPIREFPILVITGWFSAMDDDASEVRLEGLVDHTGAAIHPDQTLPPSESSGRSDIAPWMYDQQEQQQQQQPSRKPSSSSRFAKHSISLLSLRQQSQSQPPPLPLPPPPPLPPLTTTTTTTTTTRHPKPPEIKMVDHGPYHYYYPQPDPGSPQHFQFDDDAGAQHINHRDTTTTAPKSKLNIFGRLRSKSRVRTNSADSTLSQQQPPPPLPTQYQHHQIESPANGNYPYESFSPSPSLSRTTLGSGEKEKKDRKLARKLRAVTSAVPIPKTLPKDNNNNHHHHHQHHPATRHHDHPSSLSLDSFNHHHHHPDVLLRKVDLRHPGEELTLDTNLDRMEGIVDPSYAYALALGGGHSEVNGFLHNPFPFGPSSTSLSRTASPPPPLPPPPTSGGGDLHRISPRSLLPPLNYRYGSAASRVSVDASEDSPSWTPPQSWAVHRDGVDREEGEYTSSEEEVGGGGGMGGSSSRKRTVGGGAGGGVNGLGAGSVGPVATAHNKKKHQKGASSGLATSKDRPSSSSANAAAVVAAAEVMKPVKMRIYKANGTYHTVTINGHIDVAAMIPKLREKMLPPGERETYRLYLREHSRERLLGPHERPAEIVRKRLGQAGYEPNDISIPNENLNFLVKFIYKSHRLGPAEDEFTFEEGPMIDLTDRGLRTIPVRLHQFSESIIRLVLSCNPMLEIPLDFIQSCNSLRDLHLSNMSMRRVPQSVRHATSLLRLDLSKNRISDLSEAFLDNLPTLQSLNLRSNRLESLPWYFPRIRALANLDVANNRMKSFPTIVFSIDSLEFLELSFNQLPEIPNEISRLRGLKDLRIAGNDIARLPPGMQELRHLRSLDCQRNKVVDLNALNGLPSLVTLRAAHNSISALDLAGLGPSLTRVDVSHNDITQLSCSPGGSPPQVLVELKLSYAKLSSIDESTLGSLVSLRTLFLNHNSITSLPESLAQLKDLTKLVLSDNKLTALPRGIGELESLRELDAHNNSLTELPVEIWNCGALEVLNLTSNLLGNWHDPPPLSLLAARRDSSDTVTPTGNGPTAAAGEEDPRYGRKGSTVSLTASSLPPLARSLKRLYLGENRLIDEVLHVLMIFKELKILNLSFNEFQDMPPNFFKSLSHLEELYLSGNKLTSLPTEDLPKLVHLKRLYLNGNKLQTLPQELGKVKNLTVLDVGSNLLKYNINNWEFDWNWNFNKNLKYLNLSGNKRLQIKSDRAAYTRSHSQGSGTVSGLQSLAGFTELSQLRVLGLMDVTMTTTGNLWLDIPDEIDDRRVRTSSSVVNGMAYGIADALGRNDHLNIVDLVHEFRGQPGEAIFAMFGVAQQAKSVGAAAPPSSSSASAGSGGGATHEPNSNHLAKFVRDKFVATFVLQLNQLKKDQKEGVEDALRRTFLRLNQELYDSMQGSGGGGGGGGAGTSAGSITSDARSIGSGGGPGGRKMSYVSACSSTTPKLDHLGLKYGATGVALYLVGKTLYVANVGDSLAVVSRQGSALLSSRRHAPFDPKEMERIRAANGWVSIDGKVNDDVDTSRSFGFYNHLPIINARPDITVVELTPSDEFVIVANRSLWDYVSYQTAVDIARTEPDPMIASQKLRDFAMSYGAEGSIMIMVIGVADLFGGESKRRNMADQTDPATINIPRKVKGGILDRELVRLEEVPAPIGHIALVFTDIRNSTHLWEVNPGMPTAMRLHNSLLRRQLRLCGGYEVKTEGDAFMCSFPTALAGVSWCLTVQDQLLNEAWPLEILECEDGKPLWDSHCRLIARGLSVRMGIHCGMPVCERDPITNRMDYFGPMVNRAARINGNAQGGHIMCSADVIREINASVFGTESETEYSKWQPQAAIDAIRRMGVHMKQVGEVKLKGLEVPELLTSIYPSHLQGRAEEQPPLPAPSVSASRVQLSWEQVRDLGVVCLRLEALSANRVFKLPVPVSSAESVKREALRKEEKEPGVEKREAEQEEEKKKEEAERYLVVDPKIVSPLVNDKSTDEQLMMALDSLSIRIDNACRAMADQLIRDQQPAQPEPASPLLERLREELDKRGGLDERTLGVFLSVLEALRPQ